ncbi:hypothetical protein [Streptomyces sp. NPDC047981]|uniref:hypothetical protein n=1 Tax=Streptomyces sp. NPDC047981 TaxID=3154610 RepID=UPI0034292B6C
MNEQTFADAMRQIRITTDGVRAAVSLDGSDMSETLAGYTVEHRAGLPPQVILFPRPDHQVAFEGMARVVVAEAADPGPTIVDFLRSINPAALDEAALNRDDLDGSSNELTKAMLAQLIDWAEGRT